MKYLFFLTSLLLISCSTGNDPFMSRSQSQSYCEKLSSTRSNYSICVRQLMLPSKYVEDCFNKKILPGTIEFNDCGRNLVLNTPYNDSSDKERKLQEEINDMKYKQRLKEIQDKNKVIK